MVTRFIRGVLLPIVLAVSSPLFGATSEDAVPQLAKSLSELPSDRPVLELPQGVFTIGSTWTISKPRVTIRGAGIGKTEADYY